MTIKVDLKSTMTNKVDLKSDHIHYRSTTVFSYPISVHLGLFISRPLNWGKTAEIIKNKRNVERKSIVIIPEEYLEQTLTNFYATRSSPQTIMSELNRPRYQTQLFEPHSCTRKHSQREITPGIATASEHDTSITVLCVDSNTLPQKLY